MVLIQQTNTKCTHYKKGSLGGWFRDRKFQAMLGPMVLCVLVLWMQQPKDYGDHLDLLAMEKKAESFHIDSIVVAVTKSDPEPLVVNVVVTPTSHSMPDRNVTSNSTVLNGTVLSSPISTNNNTWSMLPVNRPNHKMPSWMIEYFEWHAIQRAKLSEQNWNSGNFGYLIMRCLHQDSICGGTSDRLQSLPFQVSTILV